MSYWTKIINVQVRDLNALAGACKEMGCHLEQGYEAKRWGCEAVIVVPDAYAPIKVTMDKATGDYTLMREVDYEHIYKAKLGDGCGRLVQMYGVHVATAAMKKQGAQVRRQVLANGKINVIGVLQ
jgi:hypothetical protein